MRRFRHSAWVVLLSLLLATAPVLAHDAAAELRAFAQRVGLEQVDAFVETVTSLRESQRLPPRYWTKHEAETQGWRPGGDLCRVGPGRALGGDTFHNREQRLPAAPRRRWREADLDYACGKRNARRLVWSNDGLIYVTVDHYTTFREVPNGKAGAPR